MNETQKSKITRFLDDKTMSESVYGVLLDSFMKKKTGDVYMQAASFLAIGLLNDAWAELGRFRITNQDDAKDVPQIGL